MRLRRKSVVALCILVAVAQGCRQHNAAPTDLTIAYEISPLPARAGDVTITVRLTDTSAKPVAGARIALEANMSHPGMVPVLAEAKEIAPGRYRSIVKLSMAGDWYVLVHVTLPDGRELDQQFEIKEVAAA